MGWMVPMMAAAAQKQHEEQLLAELINNDKENKYEFKILRGHLRTFRKPEQLQTILEDESRAQWEMVLKLDDERIVLRRPRRAQAYDAMSGSGTDPYRTQIGNSRVAAKIYIILGLLVAGLLVSFLVGLDRLDGVGITGDAWPPIAISIAVAAVGVLMIVMLALKRNR